MRNPEHIEKRLAPLDIKLQRKIGVVTVVLAIIIVGVMFTLAEVIYSIIAILRS